MILYQQFVFVFYFLKQQHHCEIHLGISREHKRCWLLPKGSEQREHVPLISLSLVCRPEKSVQMHHGLFTERFESAELIA